MNEKRINIKYIMFINQYFGYIFFCGITILIYSLFPFEVNYSINGKSLLFISIICLVTFIPYIVFYKIYKDKEFILNNSTNIFLLFLLICLYFIIIWNKEYIIRLIRKCNCDKTVANNYDIMIWGYNGIRNFFSRRSFSNININFILQLNLLFTGTANIVSNLSIQYLEKVVLFLNYMMISFITDKNENYMKYKIIILNILVFLLSISIFDNILLYSEYSFTIVYIIIVSILYRNKLSKAKESNF